MIAHQAIRENDIVEIDCQAVNIKSFLAKVMWVRYNKFLGSTIVDVINIENNNLESYEMQFIKVIKSTELVGINGNGR